MSDSEEFFSLDSDAPVETSAKRHKHAPASTLSKKPVRKFRTIPGLDTSKYDAKAVTSDVRFNPAYGKADLDRTRANYRFLDEYREQEVEEMRKVLADPKLKRVMLAEEFSQLEQQQRLLKSRLETMKRQQKERTVVADFKREQRQKVQSGEQKREFHLKRSDRRKLVQKARFESMPKKQRDKAIERKRKKRLGQEFRRMEYRTRDD